MAIFRVNDKVVCIDDVFDKTKKFFSIYFKNLPVEGVTYTVRETDGTYYMLLEEIVNPEHPENIQGKIVIMESGFHVRRFRHLEVQQASKDFAEEMLSNLEEDMNLERLLNPEHDYEVLEVEVNEGLGFDPAAV